MKASEYYPPEHGKGQFHCPHCNVYAKQFYAHLATLTNFHWASTVDSNTKFAEQFSREWVVTKCEHCGEHIFWFEGRMIYPKAVVVAPPNPDMSEEIKDDYLEAASILSESPRAAAALLRLALQKLCQQLGEKGENINDDIKRMVARGLNPLVQKSLDALRITGNNAVHPGEINLQEEPQRVLRLFELLNFIANKMITEPREIEGFYAELPENSRQAVEKRDGKS